MREKKDGKNNNKEEKNLCNHKKDEREKREEYGKVKREEGENPLEKGRDESKTKGEDIPAEKEPDIIAETEDKEDTWDENNSTSDISDNKDSKEKDKSGQEGKEDDSTLLGKYKFELIALLIPIFISVIKLFISGTNKIDCSNFYSIPKSCFSLFVNNIDYTVVMIISCIGYIFLFSVSILALERKNISLGESIFWLSVDSIGFGGYQYLIIILIFNFSFKPTWLVINIMLTFLFFLTLYLKVHFDRVIKKITNKTINNILVKYFKNFKYIKCLTSLFFIANFIIFTFFYVIVIPIDSVESKTQYFTFENKKETLVVVSEKEDCFWVMPYNGDIAEPVLYSVNAHRITKDRDGMGIIKFGKPPEIDTVEDFYRKDKKINPMITTKVVKEVNTFIGGMN